MSTTRLIAEANGYSSIGAFLNHVNQNATPQIRQFIQNASYAIQQKEFEAIAKKQVPSDFVTA